MNSRSQSKIRNTNKANILAEQRYLKSKNLIRENNDLTQCFTDAGLDVSNFSYCISSGTMGPDRDKCIEQIKNTITDTEKLKELMTCASTKIDLGDIINTGINTGIDILNKLPNIFGGEK